MCGEEEEEKKWPGVISISQKTRLYNTVFVVQTNRSVCVEKQLGENKQVVGRDSQQSKDAFIQHSVLDSYKLSSLCGGKTNK